MLQGDAQLMHYWNNLRRHPGVPVATALTIMGFVAGIDHLAASIYGGLIGAAVMGLIYWPIVLWTAARRPPPRTGA